MPATEATTTPAPAPWWKSPWVRRGALIALGLLAPVLCPLLPWPPARVVCTALANAVAQVGELPTVSDGGVP